MAELDKLCYSPSGGNLAYHSTDDNLIYKGTSAPPTPPTEYGDAIITVTVNPSYIRGADISGTGADYRLWVSFNEFVAASLTTNSFTLASSQFRGTTYDTLETWIHCGWGYYWDIDAPITVDISVVQPSSGYVYTTRVYGNLREESGEATHNGWDIAITGDSRSMITFVSVAPRWQ